MSRPIFAYAYNSQFDPAMPVVEVGLSLLQQSQAATKVNALVDSGSDITLVPLDALEAIGAKPIDTVRIRGILGASQPANLYLVCLYIGSHRLPAVHAVAIDTPDDCLVGRNVLNHLEVILNGPAGMTEVLA